MLINEFWENYVILVKYVRTSKQEIMVGIIQNRNAVS